MDLSITIGNGHIVIHWQWAQTEMQKVPSEHEETLFDCEGDRALAQVAQGGCGVSLLRDTEKPTRHGPGQLALGGPA